MGDDQLDIEVVPESLEEEWTHEQHRAAYDLFSERIGEWQGVPVPVEDLTISLCPGHPLHGFYDSPPAEVRVVVGGPAQEDMPQDPEAMVGEVVRRSLEDERVVNEWYDPKRNRDVLIFQRPNGRAFAIAIARAPERSMDRLTLALSTLGASDAWSLDAEMKAMEKLGGMLSDRQWRHYLLTGSFLESSSRSGLTYVFRRLRPTIVLTPRWPWWRDKQDAMRCLAVLCMHPIGFYNRSWAGCMVPSDDVIAHLLMMRGDEAGFWRQANQHDPAAPEAGL